MKGKYITQIFAGSVHTCALTGTGEIYSFGKHEYTGIMITTIIVDVAATILHIICIIDYYIIYMVGHGNDSDVLYPMLLDSFQGKNICQVRSCSSRVVVE